MKIESLLLFLLIKPYIYYYAQGIMFKAQRCEASTNLHHLHTPKSTQQRKDANMVAGFSYKNIVTYLTIIIKWFMCLCYVLSYCTV